MTAVKAEQAAEASERAARFAARDAQYRAALGVSGEGRLPARLGTVPASRQPNGAARVSIGRGHRVGTVPT